MYRKSVSSREDCAVYWNDACQEIPIFYIMIRISAIKTHPTETDI